MVCASSSLNRSLLHDTVLSYSAASCGPRVLAPMPADLLQSMLDLILCVVQFAARAAHFGLSLSGVFDQRAISEGLGITAPRTRNFGPPDPSPILPWFWALESLLRGRGIGSLRS